MSWSLEWIGYRKLNPVIDWQSCTLKITVKGLKDSEYLFGMPVDPVTRVELCKSSVDCKGFEEEILWKKLG